MVLSREIRLAGLVLSREIRLAGLAGIALGACSLAAAQMPTVWLALLVAAVLFVCLAAVTGELRRLLLAAALLDIPLQLGVHLGFRADVASLGGLVGWDVSVTTAALVGLYATWTLQLLGRIGLQRTPAVRECLPAAVYLGCVALSLVVAEDIMLASFELVLLLQMFLLYFYIVSTVRTREDVVFVVSVLFLGLALEAVLMLGPRFTGHALSIPGLTGRVGTSALAQGQGERIGGTIGSANAAAIYLSLLLVPAMTVLLTPLGRWHHRLSLAGLALGAVALALTLSRGGWVAFGLSLAIVCFLANRRGWLSMRVPVLLVCLLLILGLVFQDAIAARLLGDDQGSARSRLPLIGLAWRIIQDHPLLGVGANNYVPVMQRYVTPDFSDYGGEWLFLVHDHYLLIWAETGAIGLGAFIWFVSATLWAGWRGWRLDDRLLAPLAIGFTAAIVGHLIYMSVDLFNDRPQAQTLWTCAAILVAIGRFNAERVPVPMPRPHWLAAPAES